MNEGAVSTQAQGLLNLSRTLNKYQGLLNRQTGEQFNLFNIIGSCEATHSNLLAELLNPEGSHGQGDIFLRDFVNVRMKAQSAEITFAPLDYGKVQVFTEFSIGHVTEESGGRIDILIREGNESRIIIENKIYATEQIHQVNRYEKFAPGAAIVFLSLDGREPQSLKDGKRPKNLICISYKEHILEWLKACQKEAVGAPPVREAIAQYIGLIKQITNRTISDHMSQEIIKAALADKETIHAFFSLTAAYDTLRKAIINKMYEQLHNIAQQLELRLERDDNLASKDGAFMFAFLSSKFSDVKCKIGFGFDRANYNEFCLGFCDMGALGSAEERNRLRDIFSKQYGNAEQSAYWPAWVSFRPYRSWSNDVFEKIYSGDFAKDVELELKKLIRIFDEYVITRQVQPSIGVTSKPSSLH